MRSRKATLPDIPLPETHAKPGTRTRVMKNAVKLQARKHKTIEADSKNSMDVKLKEPEEVDIVAKNVDSHGNTCPRRKRNEERDRAGEQEVALNIDNHIPSTSLSADIPDTAAVDTSEQFVATLSVNARGLRNEENDGNVTATTRDIQPPQKPRPIRWQIRNGHDSQNDDNKDDQFLSSRRGYRQLQFTIRDSSPDPDGVVFKGFTSRISKASNKKADIDMEDAQQKSKGRADHVSNNDSSGVEDDGGSDGENLANESLEKPDDEVEADDELETHRHKSGPLPKAAKEAAFAAHQEYLNKLEALASEYDKPLKLLLQLVAQEVKTSHHLNPWSAFQHWYTHFGNVKKTKDISAQAWAKFVARLYKQELDSLGEKPSQQDIHEHFKEQLDYYRNVVVAFLESKRDNGKFPQVIKKVVEPFIKLATRAYKETGIQVFGFAIVVNANSTSSLAWGSSREYEKLRARYKSSVKTQLRDYEGMFKLAEMDQRMAGSSNSLLVHVEPKSTENKWDCLMRVLGEFLRSDLIEILTARNEEGGNMKKVTMNWSWTDFAFKNEVTIIGWGLVNEFPCEGFTLKGKGKGEAFFQWIVQSRVDEYKWKRGRQVSDDEEIDMDSSLKSPYVRIVSWTSDKSNVLFFVLSCI
ncbi:uncharacterized protein LACBIDRAFT_324774 [Laccaria bicolor S238N-H82]|uniref:Predicted protein n=1 Tax=Laccaria bicolor (strain S238N-H82 / ATCC MYA-4686) TaxID=486041 RepID=B0D302_LACBS|nr:uncharacterized protein LACBIDRAFT_324774 [Laccaria bicolor S238N-H82]EDR11188.1 predicted protein [Laccaria bicolor S238N-H82]|eukprot:XP_001878489.1 predicted protein [Laccaria bicolor S238N-H82]